MVCTLNGNIVEGKIKNFLRSKIRESNLFTGDDNFTALAQNAETQSFINRWNKSFGSTVLSLSGRSLIITIPTKVIEEYFVSTNEGGELSKLIDEYSFETFPNSPNKGTMFSILNNAQISEFTNEKLIKFLQSINPDFRVEIVENLPQEGVTKLKEFLIQIRIGSEFKALPEEVAHVLIGLLPEDHPLKKDMLDNITSFNIYSETLKQYKGVYLTEDGKVDYNKIKVEASGKLVAGYITAIATGDNSKVNEMTKQRGSFLKRWLSAFLKWLGISMSKNTHSYVETATMILSGENTEELLDPADISYTDSFFYLLSEDELFNNVLEIYEKNPPKLLDTIDKFTKEFRRVFNSILHDDKFSELDEELKREGDTVGKLNKLAEISNLLGQAGYDIKKVKSQDSYILGLKQFLEAVDNMEILANAIYNVVQRKAKGKDFDEAVKNINELEGYMAIYENFNNIISQELSTTFIASGVGKGVIDSILKTTQQFKSLNAIIAVKLQAEFSTFFQDMLKEVNESMKKDLEAELEANKNYPKVVEAIKKKIKKHNYDAERIMKMLAGKDVDTDGLSVLNHFLNAAILNSDMYIASIASYIQSKMYPMQQRGKSKVLELNERLDPIIKKLKMPSHVIGEKISYIETVYDPITGEPRSIRRFLNEWKGIDYHKDKLMNDMYEARREYANYPDRNDNAKLDELFKVYEEKRNLYNDFIRKYYNKPYTKEYYDFINKYESNPTFISVMKKFEELTDAIQDAERLLSVDPNDNGAYMNLLMHRRERANLFINTDFKGALKSQVEQDEAAILREYFDERSKFTEVDLVQTERTYLIHRNRYNQKVEFAIQKVKKEGSKNILQVEESLRRALGDPTIMVAYSYNSQSPASADIDYEIVKNILLQSWRRKNVTYQKNEQYFEDEALVLDEIKRLKDDGKLDPVDAEISDLYQILREMKVGTRDSVGQINPDSLSKEEINRINAIEDRIQYLRDLKGVSVNTSVMTKLDKELYDELTEIISDETTTDGQRLDALRQRAQITNRYRKSKSATDIRDLYEVLGSLSHAVPTNYYWDKIGQFVPSMYEFARHIKSQYQMDRQQIKELDDFVRSFEESIDSRDHHMLDFNVVNHGTFVDYLEFIKDDSPELYTWFKENHRKKKVFDKVTGKKVELEFVKDSIHLYKIPTKKEHRKEVYNKKFIKYKIKDKAKEIVGETVTNRNTEHGYKEFLPLTLDQGAPADSPYINKEYVRMKASSLDKNSPTHEQDKLLMEYLSIMKEVYLEHQEMVDPRLRTWMDAPVASLTNVEDIKNVPEVVKKQYNIIKSAFSKDQEAKAEAQEEGIDTVEEFDYTAYELIRERIPKLGMSHRIPVERVSTDFHRSMIKYIFRAHELQARNEVSPVMKALIKVLKPDDAILANASNNKERVAIFEKMYSQFILEEVPGGILNSKVIRRVARLVTGMTSMKMLLDPVGGVFNYGAASVSNLVEASGSKFLNLSELAMGEYLATKTLASLAADFNKKSGLGYYTLLFEYVSFSQGEYENDMLDRSSSLNKKLSFRQLAMIPRSSLELHAQASMALGIMHRHKVKNEIDKKEYPMHEIYEVKGNKLVLKKGFPESYNLENGKSAISVIRTIHSVNLMVQGNYSKMNATEASRYALGMMGENLKKWFMTALTRRYGRESPDIVFGDLNEGYYRTAGQAIGNIGLNLLTLDFNGAKGWLSYYLRTPRLKRNLSKAAMETAIATAIAMFFMFVLGFAGDDKNKELKDNSWFHNTMILISLRIFSEITSYVPIPQLGLQELKRNVLSPFAIPADALSNVVNIGHLLVLQVGYWFNLGVSEKNLYFQKDSGFWFTEEGDSKLVKYILNTAGHVGYTLEPAPYIERFNNLQNRMK